MILCCGPTSDGPLSFRAKWEARGHSIKTKMAVVGSAWRMYRKMRTVNLKGEDGEGVCQCVT